MVLSIRNQSLMTDKDDDDGDDDDDDGNDNVDLPVVS